MEGNGTRYIEKIAGLYSLDDSTKADLLENVDKIDEQLNQWGWDDIEYAIDFFYTKKSDRNYPKAIQIRAILNSNRNDRRDNFNAQSDKYDYLYQPPRTNIRAISDVFLHVCREAYKQGVMRIDYFWVVEKLEMGNDKYVKDCRIYSKRDDWVEKVKIAQHRFPDIFGKFKTMTYAEACAFAYKLGILNPDEYKDLI